MDKIYCKNCEHWSCDYDFTVGIYKCMRETLYKNFDPIVGTSKTVKRHVIYEDFDNDKIKSFSPHEYHKCLNESNDCKYFKIKSHGSKSKPRYPKVRSYNEGCLVVILVPLTLIGALVYKCII